MPHTEASANGKKMQKKKCENDRCGKNFAPATSWQKFCALDCAARARAKRHYELVQRIVAEARRSATAPAVAAVAPPEAPHA